jgi:hypothetical protein
MYGKQTTEDRIDWLTIFDSVHDQADIASGRSAMEVIIAN